MRRLAPNVEQQILFHAIGESPDEIHQAAEWGQCSEGNLVDVEEMEPAAIGASKAGKAMAAV